VRIDLFDVSGRLVRTLVEERRLPAGRRETAWDGRGDDGRPAASGIYFYRMRADGFRETRRVVLVR
jgi:flagellar hook assembly protein FlgD